MRSGIIAAILLAPLSVAQAAQPDAHLTRTLLAEYGKCIVKREPARARAFVLSSGVFDPSDPDNRRLVQRECVNMQRFSAMRFANETMKGAAAEALIKRDGMRIDPASLIPIPPLAQIEPWPVRTVDAIGKPLSADRISRQQQGHDNRVAELARARLAECVVRAESASARSVLDTVIDKPGELASLKALAPAMAVCLPAGQTAGFDRMTLRGSIAVAYYRLGSAINGASR